MPKVKDRPCIPLFHFYSISQLAELTPYEESYLVAVREGWKPLTEKFIATICGILQRPKAELFSEEAANPKS